MEERKLNFNAPLMSVRRSSTATKPSNVTKGKKFENAQLVKRNTLPSYKSDFNLDQVTEPVAVPFHWEQIPGRRKDGSKPDPRGCEEASVTPRFTPRRALDVVKHIEDKKPEDQVAFRPQIQSNSFNDIANGLDCSKEGVNEKSDFNSENDDDDDLYSDARDTLSGMDSFSVDCSVSGVSGFDSLAVKPSGTFNADPQTRDFMMSRFLPAAKAMTLEAPQYASRKQPVSGEQPRQIVQVVQRDRTPPVNRKESFNVPSYHQDLVDEESEDECDQYVNYGKIMTKGCGLLPLLCVKNSLRLVNPVPGMKVRNQSPMSAARDIKRMTKSVYSRSQSPTINKPAKDPVHKKEPDNEVQSPRLVGVDNKLTGGSNRFTYARDRQMISRTSPFRRSGAISPYRNEAPQSPFPIGGFLGVPKDLENFKANKLNLYGKCYSKSQELVPYHGLRHGSRPLSPTTEKTLYVDTVNVAGLLCSNAGSSDIKKGGMGPAEKDIKSLLSSREIQETYTIESTSKDVTSLNFPEQKSGDADLSLLSDMSTHRDQWDTGEDLSQESLALVCVSTTTEGNLNIENDQISNMDIGNAKTGFAQCSLPPSLPKTPSESWLSRTLPTVSSQNPSSHLYRGTNFRSKRQDSKTTSTSTKWENIVKSSYLHNDHVRYSEELFPHASQQF
ncbi:hypothetical protein JCGZ_21573 [Jatropha curcas]|uniref:Uncharacterized protein n=2 Tax=Jatropha curcas TaxID=180498 RepID=A0A067JBF4_JATCU|nr:hypothetical protein JCGZ_21573 [Jatropha curcas]